MKEFRLLNKKVFYINPPSPNLGGEKVFFVIRKLLTCASSFQYNKITALLCVLLLFASCATTLPSAADPIQPEAPEGTLSVPYCSSDSLNPFFTEGEDNAVLWPLAFLPLYALDSNFTPQPVMAASATQTATEVQVTIKPGILTAQGLQLSVADVLYSFRLAKESPAFKTQLSAITNVSIGATSDVVVFTLKRPNINACSLLTFPIVQYGTADRPTDLPIGAGAYSYTKTADGTELTYNPNYYDGNVRAAQINLVDSAADASKAFSLKSERIDCSFSSLANGEVLRLAATATTVPMTNLVFLGVNAQKEHLNSPVFRRAVSKLIDRQSVVEHAFCGYAQATSLPVHPDWSALQTENAENFTTADVYAAQSLISEYETGESELIDQADPTLIEPQTRYSLELICCENNNFKTGAADRIADQLAAADIKVRVRVMSEEAYFKAIREGNYDLYLGEVKLTADMNLSVFLFPGNPLGWGIDNEKDTTNAVWESYCAGVTPLGEFLQAFAAEMPFIPICYRQGIFYTSRSLVNEVICTPDNLFNNIDVWEKADKED